MLMNNETAMQIGFVTIHVNNMEDSIKFYSEIIGMKTVSSFKPSSKMTIVFMQDNNSQLIELIHEEGVRFPEAPANVVIGFTVDDIYETEKFLVQRGIKINVKPYAVPSGVILMFIKDPNGVSIEFVQNFKL